MVRMLGLAVVDCGAAALVFWCLWAGHAGVGLLPIFLLAYGAGLLSGTPGGVGAFELTLLALLPGQAEAPLLAAALAYRGVYFVVPAMLAAGVVLLGPRPVRRDDVVAAVPGSVAFPEAGLMRQGVFQPLVAGGTLFAAARTAHALVALREPLAGGGGKAEIAALIARAAREARSGVLYKAPPRLALAAREAGLAVLPLAREAWVHPSLFALESPACAALRRKLRKAAQAGVLAQCEAPQMAELARITADWVRERGGEMGFSMGRFAPGYLSSQRVYVARIDARPVGFATFHATASGWALDLLRPHPDAPDGTAHCLIAAAIADATRASVPRVSLAAVPNPAFADGKGLLARLTRWHPDAQAAALGLYQFKSAFAPQWERLYLVAPNWPAMALAGWEIRRAILHPAPLPALAAYSGDGTQIEIASAATAWHRKRG
jgi:phosphatidylglycerol lysyltransferase